MNFNKYFIITIDTEEDNQWNFDKEATTENVKFLPRFQELAEKYDYKPVWLTTYGMAQNNEFVDYFKEKQKKGLCEIGMHLHAWNTPPKYELKEVEKQRPYLIEYPLDVMENKIRELDNILTKKFEMKPISHRAGRWATNEDYFKLLKKYDYKIDCSVTPHIDWTHTLGLTGKQGTNYKEYPEQAYPLFNGMLEVPVTIRQLRAFEKTKIKTLKKFVKEVILYITKKSQWIRPSSSLCADGMKKVIDKCNKNNEYIMFMIHSSELMPGGSPNFKTEESIEKLYQVIEELFKYSKQLGYKGITLREYYSKYTGSEKNE